MEDLVKVRVVKPIAYGGRKEPGEIVLLPAERAKAYSGEVEVLPEQKPANAPAEAEAAKVEATAPPVKRRGGRPPKKKAEAELSQA
jgi:hypothetical protein